MKCRAEAGRSTIDINATVAAAPFAVPSNRRTTAEMATQTMLADLDREHLPNHHATHLLPTFQQSFTHPAPAVQPSDGTQLGPQTHGAESAFLGTDHEQYHAEQPHHEAQHDHAMHVAELASLFSGHAQHPDFGNAHQHRALLASSPHNDEHPRMRYSITPDEEQAFTAATGRDASSGEDSASLQGQAAVGGQSQSQPDQATFSDSAYDPFKAHARECSEQQLHLRQQQQKQQRQQQQHQQQQQLQQQQSVMSGGGSAMLRNMSANRPGSLSNKFARSNLSSIEEGTGSGIGNHGAGATGVAFYLDSLRQTWKLWPQICCCNGCLGDMSDLAVCNLCQSK